MEVSYEYKIIKGSWGIAIRIVLECETTRVLPPEAQEVANHIWLWVDQAQWCPKPREWDALRVGVRLVEDSLKNSGRMPLLVRVREVEFKPTDYQEEGLSVAIAEALADLYGFECPDSVVYFDREANRYVFELAI